MPAKWRQYNLNGGVLEGLDEMGCVNCLAEVLTTQGEHYLHNVNGAHSSLFLHSRACSRHVCYQRPLISLKELFIHKLILKQSLDRHDSSHEFVFCLQVNHSCVSNPTHKPHHHIPLFLFMAIPCFPEHLAQTVKQNLFTTDSSNTEWHTFSLETWLGQPWHGN